MLAQLVASARFSREVRERTRFIVNDARRASGVRRYHLRRSALTVLLRHDPVDRWTFDEVLYRRVYEPPAAAARVLATLGPRRHVLDVGANIGLFGAWWLERDPEAEVTAFEPHPRNVPIHRRVVAENSALRRWRLVEAAATTRAGRVRFRLDASTDSHITDTNGADTVEVRAIDLLPLLAHADLLKLDIEGAEWPILADPRFGTVPVVVLEFHRRGCPEDQPDALAARLLDRAGYDVSPILRDDDGGGGVVWGVRRPS